MSAPQQNRGAKLYTMDDYLGCSGLDWSGNFDPLTGTQSPPSWQPVEGGDEEFGSKVVEFFRAFRDKIEKNGLQSMWRRNYRQFFNGPAGGSSKDTGWSYEDSFQIVGENGEVLNVRLSEPRTLIIRMANLACSKPVALRAVAKSAKPKALEDAQIADSVLRQDFDPIQGGQLIREGVEMALAVTCMFFEPEWDQLAGEAYVPTDDGGMFYSGKPKLGTLMPDEFAFDLTKKRVEDVVDCVTLGRANRYVLASQFPDLEEKILSVPSLNDSEFKSFRYEDEDTNDIVVLKYRHRPVNKQFLPEGRFALVLEDGTVLRDGPNPYAHIDPQHIGIFPLTSGSSHGSLYGYATMNDLSPLSQWLNVLATMLATLVVSFGAPNMTGPPLQGVQVQELIGGGRYFPSAGSQGKVEALNLLDSKSIEALLKCMEFVVNMGEKHSGMSGLIREPGDGDSGKKTAIMQSMAAQFMSSLQQSVIATNQAIGNYNIRLRQKFSTAEEVAELSNDGSQQVVNYRAQEAFANVATVEAEPVDPLTQTIEGREIRADKLMQLGAFGGPNDPMAAYNYMLFMKTGNDAPLFRKALATANLINRENSMIMKAKSPQDVPIVLEGHDHEKHISSHMDNDSDPNMIDNTSPAFMANQEHIARHKMFAMGLTPMQGVDPQSGQPYPPATVQFQQAEQQRQMQEQQMAMQQAQAGQQPAQGKAQGPGAPQQGGQQPQGAPPAPPAGGPGPQQPPRTAQDAMQAAAMGQQ
jgi:hypothetical protein